MDLSNGYVQWYSSVLPSGFVHRIISMVLQQSAQRFVAEICQRTCAMVLQRFVHVLSECARQRRITRYKTEINNNKRTRQKVIWFSNGLTKRICLYGSLCLSLSVCLCLSVCLSVCLSHSISLVQRLMPHSFVFVVVFLLLLL